MKVFVSISIPSRLAGDFPEKPEDSSPTHITLAYFPDAKSLDDVVHAATIAAQSVDPFELEFGDYGEFINQDGLTICHSIPRSAGGELESLRRSILDASAEDVSHSDTPFKPHITLAYLDRSNPSVYYSGPRPRGRFIADSIEISSGEDRMRLGLGSGDRLMSKSTRKPRPLVKELAFPGTFTDALGRKVTFTPELLKLATEGTQQITKLGFQVRGYTSHFTDDSNDVMGKWPEVFLDHRGHPFGVFQPMTEKDRERALELDASVLLEKDVQVGDVVVPFAFTRIDIVGQGAIVGTERFRALFERYINRRKLVGAFSSAGVFATTARTAKEEARMARALGMAIGLEDGATKSLLDNLFVKNVLGLQETASDEEILDAMNNIQADDGEGDPEADPEADPVTDDCEDDPEADPETDPEDDPVAAAADTQLEGDPEADPEAEEGGDLASALAMIAEMQEEKVEGLFSRRSINKEDKIAVMGFYRKLRDKAGHELAFEAAESKAASLSKAIPGASAKKKTRVAPRKADGKSAIALLSQTAAQRQSAAIAALSIESPTLQAFDRQYGPKSIPAAKKPPKD